MHERYQEVLETIGVHELITKTEIVSGGCINNTLALQTQNRRFFLKENTSEYHDLFEKERIGLSVLCEKSQINTPTVLGHVTLRNYSYLVLEWIEKGNPNTKFWTDFGQKLALQHKQSGPQFGLDHNNHIGRLNQSNTFHDNWTDFFIIERLTPQIRLAEEKQLLEVSILKQFESLFKKFDQLIPKENPSLLHGDLWSGNFLCDSSSQPYIFDPAVYYGHRETELAFTQLFGGFKDLFYASYENEFPLQPGFQERVDIHNLYPLLVHVNLFGVSYLNGIQQTLNRFA